jgi:ABC-type multidrug transport system fused ATPase/permease subunit
MFISGVGDFLFPDLIGKVINGMRNGDKEEISRQIVTWIVIIAIGAIGTMCNSMLSGVTAERIGNSLRQKLFASLIRKDTAFYDVARTGDLCKYFYL